MTINRRHFIKTSLAAGAAISVPRLASAAQTLHLSHIFNLEDPKHIAADQFAKKVAEQTGGEVIIKIHPLSQIAGLRDGVEGTRLGTIDMTMADTATLGSWAPELGLWSLPFVFRDYDQVLKVMQGPVEDWRVDVIKKKVGLMSIGHAVTAFRVIINTERPLTNAQDIVGLKMRVPEIPVYVSTFRALQSNPTPIPWGETYSALQTGTVEGVESDPIGLSLAKFTEVTKFASKTNHILLDAGLLVNQAKFAKLSKKHQEILVTLGNELVSRDLSESSIVAQNQTWDEFGKKLQVNDVDVDSFREKLAPLVDEFSKAHKTQDIIKTINAT
ncbi:MAG: DctP family TRAP transporter solute-binding subunit [Pusillimonas sp.]